MILEEKKLGAGNNFKRGKNGPSAFITGALRATNASLALGRFLVVTMGRAERKKEDREAKFLQLGDFFGSYLLGQDNRIQYKPEEFILPVFKKTYCSLESCSGRAQLIKTRFIERVGTTRLNFYFPFISLSLLPSLLVLFSFIVVKYT